MHLKTLTFTDGRTLEIHSDDDPMHPRTDCDNLGTIVCRRGNFHHFGDEEKGLNDGGDGCERIDERIRLAHPACVMLPIFIYSHSGISINTTGFNCPWDSGRLGTIFISRERINAEYGTHGRTQIEGYLRGEIETYDQFLRGDIWGFIVRDLPCVTCGGPGKEGDSCWGFYGDDPIENGMIDNLDLDLRDWLRTGDFTEVSH